MNSILSARIINWKSRDFLLLARKAKRIEMTKEHLNISQFIKLGRRPELQNSQLLRQRLQKLQLMRTGGNIFSYLR